MVLRAASGGNVPGRFGARAVYSGSGSSLPSLPQVGSLVTRFSASDIPTQTDGTKVLSWTDGIAGIVASQGTSANQPTYVANALGGKPGVAVNGSQWLSIATPGIMGTAMTSTTYTVLMVVTNVSATTFGGLFGGNAAGTGHFYLSNGTVSGHYNGGTVLNTVPSPPNNGLIAVASISAPAHAWGGACWRQSVNGSVYSEAQGAGPSGIGGGLGIGASNSTGQFAGIGTILEVLVWNTDLTPTELLQVQAWLCAKYAQTTPWSAGTSFVVFDGDSQTAGQAASKPSNSYPYLAAASLGLGYGQWTNTGFRGITLSQMNSKVAEFSGIPTLVAKRVVVSTFEYYNSRGLTGAVNYTSFGTYITSLKAMAANVKVVTGSSISSGSDPDTNRNSYNTLLDATPLGDYYTALHTLTHIGVSGGAAANPTYFNADLIHPADLGYAELAPAFVTPIASAIAAP